MPAANLQAQHLPGDRVRASFGSERYPYEVVIIGHFVHTDCWERVPIDSLLIALLPDGVSRTPGVNFRMGL